MKLNPQQEQAVQHRGTPLLVLAGAGTGKTRVITHRVAQLVNEGVPPWRILAVTFTNKAAREMRERIERLSDGDLARSGLWIGTFHSICARILRRHGESVGLSPRFTIYDTSDQRTLMNRVLKDLNLSDRSVSTQSVLGLIDRAKNQGLGRSSLHTLCDDPVKSIVDRAWMEYERRLRASDAADFNDLISLSVELLEGSHGELVQQEVDALRRRFAHVVVDEFQDTNPVQARLIDLLSGHAELCVVGDDDQSIYSWRGADVGLFLDFPERHGGCEVVRLEENYRSTMHILNCADAVICKNHGRLGKTLFSSLGDGEQVEVVGYDDERNEAMSIAERISQSIADGEWAPAEIAIFYRTHAQSRPLEEAMRRYRLGYRIVGGTRFFDRTEVKDLLAWLRVLDNGESDLDLERIINVPARGIGAATLDKLRAYALTHEVSLLGAIAARDQVTLGAGARKKLAAFHALLEELRAKSAGLPIDEIADLVLTETGYREALAALDGVEKTDRLENLQELVGSMQEALDERPELTLAEYLDDVALASSPEEGQNGGLVTLMTVHSAKGLEFDTVFVTGMEERVFPHVRAYDDPDQMEEERRLAYVALTRAARHLSLSYVETRFIFGQRQINRPSRFVQELPRKAVRRAGGASEIDRSEFAPVRGLSRRSAVDDDLTTRRPTHEDDEWGDISRPAFEDDAPPRRSRDVDESGGEGVQLYVGLRLRHPSFGLGELVAWSGMGDGLKLTIQFPRAGLKTILARYCQPG